LLKLQANLGKSLNVIDFTPDSRPYSPHLIIGRVKKDLPNALLKRLGQALETEAATVDHLATVYSSPVFVLHNC